MTTTGHPARRAVRPRTGGSRAGRSLAPGTLAPGTLATGTLATGIVAGVAAIVLTGCAGSGLGAEPAASAAGSPSLTGTTSATASPTAASASASTSPSASASTSTDGPPSSAPQPSAPASTAGSLRQSSLPAPASLGPGWRYRVDNGNVEGNYVGNGTPSQERRPAELVAALRPIGCGNELASTTALPAPTHALEVDYGHSGGATGVALALDFGSDAGAARFVTAYRRALSTCTPAQAPEGTLQVTVLATPRGAELLTRQVDPLQDSAWTELVARNGRSVTVIGVDITRGSALPRWDAVAESIG